MDRFQAVFWAAPPVARTITALTMVQSVLVYSSLLSGYYVVFLPGQMFKLLPEVWRLATPFLLTGPKLSFFFDLYFMFHYSNLLETGSARFSQPGDFFVYLVFVGLTIMITAGYLLGGMIFTSALILAFIYTYAQDNRGKRAMFWFVEIPMEYLPWAMLVITLVMGGPSAALSESMGIVAAHLYDFITRIYPTFGGGRNYLVTPASVQRFFARNTPNAGYRGYGTAFRPSQPSQSSTASRGWTSSLQSPWSGRGAGRRLGGD
ncbi:derlin-1 [Penicillium hispanicum]|uniref:derlin-1 n=1 Tax=Penicillium hispanicum TaxID=1080232 RepID=UPI00254234C7|nr:derlin-1 [Penicillium hispanicum]KAJ5584073.1 derlin-1 [Penicillium hispanicum]